MGAKYVLVGGCCGYLQDVKVSSSLSVWTSATKSASSSRGNLGRVFADPSSSNHFLVVRGHTYIDATNVYYDDFNI